MPCFTSAIPERLWAGWGSASFSLLSGRSSILSSASTGCGPRAQKLDEQSRFRIHLGPDRPAALDVSARSVVPAIQGLAPITRISDTVSPLAPGPGATGVDMLVNGEQAYPAMLRAIENAPAHTVHGPPTFLPPTPRDGGSSMALGRAGQRGVDVRVIVDGGRRLVFLAPGPAFAAAKRYPGGPFSAPRILPPAFHLNLRNHRKLLVSDGQTGFVGGHEHQGTPLGPGLQCHGPGLATFTSSSAGRWWPRSSRLFWKDWGFLHRRPGTCPRGRDPVDRGCHVAGPSPTAPTKTWIVWP